MGRRRKKRRVVKRVIKIPVVFQCPNCGSNSLVVKFSKGDSPGRKNALLTCGQCGLYYEMRDVPQLYEAVDVYNKFIDLFDQGLAEVEFRREAEVEREEEVFSEEEAGEYFEE